MDSQTHYKMTTLMVGLKEALLSNPNFKVGHGSIDKIIYYIERNNFIQILYTHKADMLRALNDYFLEEEEYEYCAKIRDTILNNNKATGSQDKL
jgi:hypothetical protein